MRNLSRRLEKLESAIPAPDGGFAESFRELINRLLIYERDALKDALGNLNDGAATENDCETIRSIIKLAQERFEAGMIIVRERKSPDQLKQEMHEALRMQRETGQPWRSVSNYNEFLVETAKASNEFATIS